MTQRHFFSEDYESYCKILAPFEEVDDLWKGAKDSEKFDRIELSSEFWKKADRYFLTLFPPKKTKISDISELLNRSFIVGENHSDISPKKFLIENMVALKNAGFTTLFMEHLYYDDQKRLDDYINSGLMDDKLKNHLKALDDGHGTANEFGNREYEKKYSLAWYKSNFTAVVEAAQEAGIRVVGIDVKAVYESQVTADNFSNLYAGENVEELTKRIKSMNYVAQAIIKREQDKNKGKWFALMGNAHVNKLFDIIGVADIFGVPGVYVFDTQKSEAESVKYNTSYAVGSSSLKCDICVISSMTGDALKLSQVGSAPLFK